MELEQTTRHLDSISPFFAMDVFARALVMEAEGRDVIHLEVGAPDFQAPEVGLNALTESLSRKPARYTHTQGLLELRQEIAGKYHQDYGVRVSPAQIIVSSGSSLALYIAIRILAPAQSEVIVTDPCYACYENMILLAGAKPVRIPLRLEEGFQLQLDAVKMAVTPRTRAIIINSPMNPTGIVFSKETLAELAEL